MPTEEAVVDCIIIALFMTLFILVMGYLIIGDCKLMKYSREIDRTVSKLVDQYRYVVTTIKYRAMYRK